MENDKLIRRKQVLELIGLSHITQWRLEKAGRFPARVKLGPGSVRRHLEEVEEWVRGRERVQLDIRQGEDVGAAENFFGQDAACYGTKLLRHQLRHEKRAYSIIAGSPFFNWRRQSDLNR